MSEDLRLEEKKLIRMGTRIIEIEQKNIKTRAKSKNDMVEEIRKIIIEEANREF